MSRREAPALLRARNVLRLGLGLALFLTVFVDIAVLVVPIYDMQLFDRVLLSRNMDTVAMLSVACGVGLVIYGALDYLRSATLVAIADRVGRALSVPVLEAAVRRGMEGDSAAGAEALRDLNEIRSFLSSGAVSTPLDALCSPLLLTVMFMLHPAFGWLGMVGISLLAIVGIVNDLLVRPAVMAAAEQRARAGHQLAVGLSEADLIEGLGMFAALTRRWAGRHASALERMRHAGERAQHVGVIAKITRLGLQSGVMAMGAVLIISRQASAGSLMGANLLLAKVLGPFDSLVSSWRRWIEAYAAWRRISTLLAAVYEAADAGSAITAAESGLVLDGAGFDAPDTGRPLLQDISLALQPGTATALIGPNGAGKSTLMRILVGVLPTTRGAVRLDGIPVFTGDRGRIGYLPQGIHLLDGTISENVARFDAAPAEAVIAAAQAANVHDIIGRLRQGYDTRITRAVALLSGGQRQRVALARALYDGPRLLVLDEPDASLDQAGEEALLGAIEAARAAGVVIVVATHRPKLLARMDYTLSLRDGRVEEFVPRVNGEPVTEVTKHPVVA
ncbi:MAG: ATP-binding cassette domain-containing protein [Rhodopila sp.]|nr:ATP-binding cassette domain-containing protein [Rhodopila sp.]